MSKESPNTPESSSHRPRGKSLGVTELIAIALGGMIGGGIFTILGVSVALVGAYTPLAIAVGGGIALLAAYSYVKLGVYYKAEGATYSFIKNVFPGSPFSASLIGWWVVFGYISTLALYAYTFASYAISGFSFADNDWVRKGVASGIILLFALVNAWSVRGMGRIEDLMVYTKLVILAVIAALLISHGQVSLPTLIHDQPPVTLTAVLIVAALTFVAYEGFQLVVNAVNEMEAPERNLPRAIYSAVAIAVVIYVVIAIGAITTIPFADIVRNKEHALAAGVNGVLSGWGTELVVLGALLATSSAISGTVFGASRQMAVIAEDGYFPRRLARRTDRIPIPAVIAMSLLAVALVLIGNLQVILEFGSITFLLVSLLIAFANYRVRHLTQASSWMAIAAMLGLAVGTVLIFYYEFVHQPEQLVFIASLYAALTLSAWGYARVRGH